MGQRAATSPQASRQKQTRRYRLRDPLRRLRLAAAFCLLSLCRIVAHDNQGTVPVVVELKTKPQEALEQVLWEEHQETEEPNPFLWLKKRLRENGSFSEMLRETIYTGEIERLNPTCAVIGLLLRTVPICPFVRRLEKYILDTPPSLNKFFQHALQPTPEMNAYLPEPLAVYPDMLPAIIDERVADAERHTIYWYYAMVTRAWQHMADILRPDAAVDAGRPPLEFSDFPDWNLADGWTTGRLMKSQTGVFAVSMAKDGHLVVLMRGSTTDEDWAANFDYPFSSDEAAAAVGVPGRVHKGFLRYLEALAPLLDAEMERVAPRRVSLAGDSLGGAVAVLTGAYLTKKYGPKLERKVEVIAIGTPRVGDAAFSDYYKMHINGRSPAFMGSGIRFRGKAISYNMVWEIGDFVVQVPWDCFPIPDCVNDSSETYMYAYHGGLVKITPRMMPNEDGWIKEANWIGDFQIGFQGMVATHMCSYWCWATRGLPPPYEGSNCYFPGDKNHIGPPTDICLSST